MLLVLTTFVINAWQPGWNCKFEKGKKPEVRPIDTIDTYTGRGRTFYDRENVVKASRHGVNLQLIRERERERERERSRAAEN